MLGSSHSAASRGLLLVSAVLLNACAPPTASTALDALPPLRSFCTFRLDTASEEILIARVSARDTTSRRLANVLEIGGRVSATMGDTLVLQPYYLTTRTASDGGQPATIFRGGPAAMPDLVIIRMTPDVSIREFRMPGTVRRPRVTFSLVLGGLFLLTTMVTDAALLFSL